MRKVLSFLLCVMCVFTVGCQKKEEVVDLKETSGESDTKISGENNLIDSSDIFSGDENSIDNEENESAYDANVYEKQEELASTNKFSEPIKILKKISILDMNGKYDADWDTQKNEYPLAQKYLLKDTYENKKFGVNELEIYFCGFKYDDYIDPVFEININGVKKEVVTDEDIYVIDFDENDGYLEIATEDWWESDCSINIYR